MSNTIQLVVLTYFQNLHKEYYSYSFFKKLQDKGLLKIQVYSFLEYSLLVKKRPDYKTYSSTGLLLRFDFLYSMIHYYQIPIDEYTIIHPSPSGEQWSQDLVSSCEQASSKFLIVCSRYEGLDYRIIQYFKAKEFTIGDYILYDGDTASFVIMNSIIRRRFVKKTAHIRESLEDNLLEPNQYTRPKIFKELGVPEILYGGNHKQINQFQDQSAVSKTKQNRPDLYDKYLEYIKETKNEDDD